MTATIITDYRELAPVLERERTNGRTIALANGCFDVLHVGHVRLITDARREADVLVLALNADESVRANKGEGRPWMRLIERAEVVAALEGVHYVTSFAEPTADSLLATLQPEVHVKGTDWSADTVPERDVVRAYGGRIAICGDPKVRSSTRLIRKLGED